MLTGCTFVYLYLAHLSIHQAELQLNFCKICSKYTIVKKILWIVYPLRDVFF